MRRWTLPSRAEQGRVTLSGAWTTSTCYKPREIERLLLAACQPPSALAPVRADPRQRLHQTLAAPDTSHGGGIDRPCLDATRGAPVPRAAVAAASRGVSQPEWWEAAREESLRW